MTLGVELVKMERKSQIPVNNPNQKIKLEEACWLRLIQKLYFCSRN